MAQVLPSYIGKPLFHLRTCFQEPTGPKKGLVEGKLGLSKFGNWVLCFCCVRVLAMGNSIKEAISIMKPKLIFISILAVLFVFPLMGTFAQQASNAFSIQVITTFDFSGGRK